MSDAEQVAANLAVPSEGFSAAPYQDATGIWTQAYGSTRDINGDPVTADTPPVTRAQGLTMLERDMKSAFAAIRQDVHVPLNHVEEGALADFIYNVGAGTFKRSSVLAKLNRGDYDGAAQELERYNEAGGHILAGLVRRRAAEAAAFKVALEHPPLRGPHSYDDPIGDALTEKLNEYYANISPTNPLT